MIREEPVSPTLPPVVQRILWANVGIYLAQYVLWPGGFAPVGGYLALSRTGLLHGFFWQPFTYMFLHANFSHLLTNLIGLYFMGPDTERTIGSRRFLYLYLLSGVLGGLGFVFLNSQAPCIGASGAIYGVVAAFAALYPHRKVSLLFFPFILFRAWVLALLYGAIEFFSALYSPYGGVAHSAHLAGGLAGWIYVRMLVSKPILFTRSRGRFFGSNSAGPADTSPDSTEVDRILGKISARGLHSLSAHERDVLARASRGRVDQK